MLNAGDPTPQWVLQVGTPEVSGSSTAIPIIPSPLTKTPIFKHALRIQHASSHGTLPIGAKPPTSALADAAAMALRPAMSHSSAFLLPSPSAAAAGPDADGAAYALLVLNQRLPRFAPRLWDRAQVRVCADGGANRVFDGMPELFPGQDPDEVRRSVPVFLFLVFVFVLLCGGGGGGGRAARYKPDVIKGDLDSVRPEVKEYYSNMGTQIVDESHDQDTTDLHKCVAFITENSAIPNKSNLCILALGALGGRFDHEMGNINIIPA
uniref:thiamine diphosphokinase n=1 Tax=Oryza meridionalis TaxID=40149 RepID=A0A0E0DQM6_9ORYZ